MFVEVGNVGVHYQIQHEGRLEVGQILHLLLDLGKDLALD